MRGRSLPYRESGTYGVARAAADEAGRGLRERPGGGDRREAPERRRPVCSPARTPTPTSSAGTSASIVGVDAGAEASDREALFYSIREFLEAAAREQPTILVFEDVHWADDNLLDLIGALATRVRGAADPVRDARASGTARPAGPTGDRGSTGYTALTLGPLDERMRVS